MGGKRVNQEKSGIIPFPGSPEEERDPGQMSLEELKAYQAELVERIAQLDAKEPANMESEAYETWADRHEELEDLLDEVIDCIEELEG